MPYMDGNFFEPDNEDRAGFANIALDAYARETRHDPREQSVDMGDADHVTEVMSDLVCDLMHLADAAGVEFDQILESARSNYDFEVMEEEDEDDEPCYWIVNNASEPAWCCNTHMYDGTGDYPATGEHPETCPFREED